MLRCLLELHSHIYARYVMLPYLLSPFPSLRAFNGSYFKMRLRISKLYSTFNVSIYAINFSGRAIGLLDNIRTFFLNSYRNKMGKIVSSDKEGHDAYKIPRS